MDSLEELLQAYLDIDCPNCRIDAGVLEAREDILKRMNLPENLHANLLQMRYDWCIDEDIEAKVNRVRELRISSNKLETVKRRISKKVASLAKPGDMVFSINQRMAETPSPPPTTPIERIKRRACIKLDTWLGNYPYDHSIWSTMLYLGYRPAPKYKSKKQLFCVHVCKCTICQRLNLGMISISRQNGTNTRKILEFHRYKDDTYLTVAERKIIVRKALAQAIRQIPFDYSPRKVILTCALGLPSKPLDPEKPSHMLCHDQVVLNYAMADKYFDHPKPVESSPFNLPERLLGHPLGHGAYVNPKFSYLNDRSLYYNTRTIPVLSLHQEAANNGGPGNGDFVLQVNPEKGSWKEYAES